MTTREGPAVLEELDVALSRAKRALADCDREATRLDDGLRDLSTRRDEALRKLAGRFLPELSRLAIESAPSNIRDNLLAILARQEAKRGDLRSRLDRATEAAQGREAESANLDQRLAEKTALRVRLEAEVAGILRGNADFQERSTLASQAEESLRRDQARVDELTREAAQKLPAYQRSRLFRYLHRRKYGTPDYAPGGWVRGLDRRVADLIDYPKALEGYEFLDKAPGLVAAEVARRRDRFAELKDQADAIEKLEADRVGLTATVAEVDALGLDRDLLAVEVERLRGEIQGLEQGLAALDRPLDEFHREAIEAFRSFLAESRSSLLQKHARQTADPEDDAIVAELAGLDERIDALGPKHADLARRRTVAEGVKEGLERVVRQYRQADYDSSRSYFEGLQPAWEIARLEDGTIDADDLWRSLRTAQKFRPIRVEDPGNDWGSPATNPAVWLSSGAPGESHRRSDDPAPASTFPTFPSASEAGGFEAPASPSMPDSSGAGDGGGYTSGEGF